jgi:succinate-acetate transporter protein
MGNELSETKMRVADPAALGVFGLAMATLVASSEKLGLTAGTGGLLPWVLFLGSIAQLMACAGEYKRDNIFAATAFGAFGLFWISVGLVWYLPTMGITADKGQLGFAFVGYLIFCIYMTYAAASLNKAFLAIFLLVDLLLVALVAYVFIGLPGYIAGIAELMVSAASFYTAAAITFKGMAGFEVLPMGKPVLKLKKFEL